jgi:hypothetical protein
MKKLDNPKFIKSWEGHWSVLTCSYFGNGRLKILKKLGIDLKNSLIIIQKGFATGYLDENEMRVLVDKFKKSLSGNPSQSLQWAERIRTLTDDIANFLKENAKENLDYKKYCKFANLITEFSAISFLVKNVSEALSSKENVFEKIKSARLYSENVYYESERFIEKVAKRMSKFSTVKSVFLLAMTDREFKNYLKNGVSIGADILKERYENSALVIKNSKEKNYFGDKVSLILKNLEINLDVKIFKGLTSYPGKVIGEVVIVREAKLVKNFKKGSILVTGMTQPDFIMYLKKHLQLSQMREVFCRTHL